MLLEPEIIAPTAEQKLIIWGGKVLESGITATINKNNSFVLTYTGRSEPLVKAISYGIIDKISKFYIDLKIDKARTDFAFATKKVDSLKRMMNAKDHIMIARDKKSLFTATDKLEYRMPYENMLADKQMLRSQYAQAVANQQGAAYRLQKATPIIRVLDSPDPPYDKDSNSPVIFGVIGLIAGMFITSIIMVSGLIYKYGKHEANRALYGESATTTVDDDGFISRVVEKPAIPKSNMALVGLYKIKDSGYLFRCLDNIIKNNIKSFNEFNLTDALQCMIKNGVKFKSFKVQNWFDCGKKETLLESNAILLKKFGGTIAETNSFENTIFIPPVSIGEGCEIKNSIIGPHVAMGDNTTVSFSVIKESIIGSYSKLYDVVLDDSLIGSDTEIRGETRSLNIGDNTEIDLGS